MRHGARTALALVSVLTGLSGGASAAPALPPPPPPANLEPIHEPIGAVRVRLYDPYRLLPRAVSGRLRVEAAAPFREPGVELRFVGSGGPGVIPATIYPELPSGWGVDPGALGVAIGTPGGPRSVFLSLGAAERALDRRAGDLREGRGRGTSHAGAEALGTALGRVLAHELIHTVAPDCPHTRGGLMAAHLSRQALTAPGVGFDELATHYLRQGILSLAADGAGSGGLPSSRRGAATSGRGESGSG